MECRPIVSWHTHEAMNAPTMLRFAVSWQRRWHLACDLRVHGSPPEDPSLFGGGSGAANSET
jgi:hypothetical protein